VQPDVCSTGLTCEQGVGGTWWAGLLLVASDLMEEAGGGIREVVALRWVSLPAGEADLVPPADASRERRHDTEEVMLEEVR